MYRKRVKVTIMVCCEDKQQSVGATQSHCYVTFGLYRYMGMLVRKGTSYSTLLRIVVMKMTFYRKDRDMKLNTLLSLFPKEKFLHITDSNHKQ